jgi:predicted amidohydrolase/N-acetylglutamate synthase-like GNAT family acetyltransferase
MLQMASLGLDQAANLGKAERFCRRAKDLDVDLALFPEMWNVGYTLQQDDPEGPGAWSQRAITLDDPFIGRARELALELELALAITFLERSQDGPRNSVAVIDRRGDVVLTYSKVHTCDFDTEACLVPGDGFRVGTLDLAEGSVEVGAMICYDREFPESARVLMLEGAEVILVPNACSMDDHRTQITKVRSMENLIGVATANYAAPQEDGHSVAFHPIAYDETGRPIDNLLVRAGPNEDVVVAEFDLDALRDWRKREDWGNAYRKPDRYGALVSPLVREPFVRPNSRRGTGVITIDPLAEHPHHVRVIAEWHQRSDERHSLDFWIRCHTAEARREGIPRAWVAFMDGEPAGSVSLVEHNMDTRPELSPWLAALWVRPEYRGRGVGTALVRRCEEETRRLGVRRLHLYTEEASGFYAPLGWSVASQEEYEGESVVVMTRELRR